MVTCISTALRVYEQIRVESRCFEHYSEEEEGSERNEGHWVQYRQH